MSFEKRESSSEERRRFWVRFALTQLMMAVLLAALLVVIGFSLPVVVAASLGSSLALLVIWDGTRWLPEGLVFWTRPEPLQDEATGAYNPAGWSKLLVAEESRCARYDLPATVLAVSVQPVSEETDRRASRALNAQVRGHDAVGYLGDGVFAVLAIQSDGMVTDAMRRRLEANLVAEGLAVRCAVADRGPARTLTEAWHQAQRALDSAIDKPLTTG